MAEEEHVRHSKYYVWSPETGINSMFPRSSDDRSVWLTTKTARESTTVLDNLMQ